MELIVRRSSPRATPEPFGGARAVAPLAGTDDIAGTPAPSSLEPWLWGLALFLMTSPFTFQLMGIDPINDVVLNLSTMRRPEGSSSLLYLLRYAVVAISLMTVLPHWRLAVMRLPRLVPILTFMLWCTMSLAWTDLTASTVNGLVALIAPVLVGFCLALRLPPHLLARSYIYSGVYMAALSIVWSVALPHYGVHQANDAHQAVHAGAWRGVYLHKNVLGAVSSLYVVLILLAGREVLPSRVVRFGLLVALALLIVKSTSATALVLPLIAPLLVVFVVRMGAMGRIVTLMIAVPLAAAMVAVTGYVVQAMGRDMTFTGRTNIWSVAGGVIARRPLTGFGYASTTYGGFQQELFKYMGVIDPHNGYLNIILGIGAVGLLLFLLYIMAAAAAARRLYLRGGTGRQASFVLFGIVATWLVASMSESHDRPLSSFAGLAWAASGMLVY